MTLAAAGLFAITADANVAEFNAINAAARAARERAIMVITKGSVHDSPCVRYAGGAAGFLSVAARCGEHLRFDGAGVAGTGDELIEGIALHVDRVPHHSPVDRVFEQRRGILPARR